MWTILVYIYCLDYTVGITVKVLTYADGTEKKVGAILYDSAIPIHFPLHIRLSRPVSSQLLT